MPAPPARELQIGRHRRLKIGDEARDDKRRAPRFIIGRQRVECGLEQGAGHLSLSAPVASCSARWLMSTPRVFSRPPTYCSCRSLTSAGFNSSAMVFASIEAGSNFGVLEFLHEEHQPPGVDGRGARAMRGYVEELDDRRRGEIGVGGALHVGRALGRLSQFLREVVERLAGAQLFHDFIGLGGQRLLRAVGSHGGLDDALHFLEALLARLFDFGDLEPDMAAVARRHCVIVHADVGGEDRLDEIGAARQPGDLLAGPVAARLVDGVYGHRRESDGIRNFREGLAGRALVLDGVAQLTRLRGRFQACDFRAQFSRGLFIALREDAGRDLAHLGDHDPESGRHGFGDARRGKRENRVGDFRIAEIARLDQAEIGVLLIDFALGDQRVEGKAALEPGDGLAGLYLRLEDDLPHFALFGRSIALGLDLVIELAHVLFRDLGRLGERRRSHGERRRRAIFLGAERLFVILVIFLQLLVGRRGNRADGGERQHEIVDRARLVAEAVDRLHHQPRRLDAQGHGVRQRLAQIGAFLVGEEGALGDAGVADDLLESVGSNWPVGPWKTFSDFEQTLDAFVADRETERTSLLVERGVGDETLEHILVEAGADALPLW